MCRLARRAARAPYKLRVAQHRSILALALIAALLTGRALAVLRTLGSNDAPHASGGSGRENAAVAFRFHARRHLVSFLKHLSKMVGLTQLFFNLSWTHHGL